MARKRSDGFSRRIRFGNDQRRTFPLPGARSQAEADKLGDELEAIARRLTSAGHSVEAAVILDHFARAEQDPERARVRRLVDSLCTAELKIDTAKIERASVTFRVLAARWTEDELAADYPDHVAIKKTSDHDRSRLEKISAVELKGGGTFGDLPLAAITLDFCEQVMRCLPEAAKRPATRRQYAQAMSRVLELAVYPCRIIDANPLPRTFRPKVGKPPAFSYLYPDEDAALMASSKVPLCYRLLWGFLAREGCRVSEAIQLRVGLDVDLERGAVKLDVNKTDDARTWALDPAVTLALAQWVKLNKLEKGALLFTDEFGRPHENDRLAERLRAHLKKAKVDREELHETGVNRRRLRAHDLRGTMVTLSLANGRTEAWVADRTGHKSSTMINRYRRSARSAQELELGPLMPLDHAIPELRSEASEHAVTSEAGQQPGQRIAPEKSPAAPTPPEEVNDSNSVAPPGLEPGRYFYRGILSSTPASVTEHERGITAQDDTRSDTGAHERPPSAPDLVSESDPVELALATALERASAAGQWTAVEVLAREVEARRKARAGVVQLDDERRKKRDR